MTSVTQLTAYEQTKKQWRAPKSSRDGGPPHQPKVIQPGDSGIWVTCNKGKEGKCIGEMRDLFNEYAETLYAEALRAPTEGNDAAAEDDDGMSGPCLCHRSTANVRLSSGADDIEKEIAAEVSDIRRPAGTRLFNPLRTDVQCGELARLFLLPHVAAGTRDSLGFAVYSDRAYSHLTSSTQGSNKATYYVCSQAGRH